ncbi:MAG: nucleoside deaminase [Proteobacteria bacterium]|nr:nucleoside deaminase [Pseudomonadota bacterium]
MTEDDRTFMARAIALSEETSLVEQAGGAFGCVIAQDGQIIGEGANRVVAENDATWHAEMAAIRNACRSQGSFKLRAAKLYTSAEPCPMCLAACYWAGIEVIYYASQVEDALEYGNFSDALLYDEIRKPIAERTIPARQIMRAEAVEVWKKYAAKDDRVPY